MGRLFIFCQYLIFITTTIFIFENCIANAKPLNHERIKQIIKLSKERTPTLITDEVNSIAREMLKYVEIVTEKKLRNMPKIQIASRKEISKILLNNRYPNIGKQNVVKHDQNLQSNYERKIISDFEHLSFYNYIDKVIYLCPQNIALTLYLYEIDQKNINSIIKLIIVHELLHAIQDQVVNFDVKYRHCEKIEELYSFNAVIEGHAAFVVELVAKKMNLDPIIAEISKYHRKISIIFKEPVLELKHEKESIIPELIYTKGKKFIEYHYRRGGNPLVWEILLKPPVKTSMIVDPTTYPAEQLENIDYSKLFESLESLRLKNNMPGSKLDFSNYEVGKFDQYVALFQIEPNTREDLVSHIKNFHAFSIKYRNIKLVSIAFILANDSKNCGRLLYAIEGYKKDYVEKMAHSNLYSVTNFSDEHFAGINADISRKMTYTCEPRDGEATTLSFYRICRNEVFIEIEDSFLGLKDYEVVDIAETIFSRYRQLIKKRKKDTK